MYLDYCGHDMAKLIDQSRTGVMIFYVPTVGLQSTQQADSQADFF